MKIDRNELELAWRWFCGDGSRINAFPARRFAPRSFSPPLPAGLEDVAKGDVVSNLVVGDQAERAGEGLRERRGRVRVRVGEQECEATERAK